MPLAGRLLPKGSPGVTKRDREAWGASGMDSHRMTDRRRPRGSPRSPRASAFRFLQQLGEIMLPESGKRVGAVAARGVADRQHDGAAARDVLDLPLEDAQLGRIDGIVGGVDGEQ